MNGHNAYSFYLIALYCLRREAVFPFVYKVIDVCCVVFQKVV